MGDAAGQRSGAERPTPLLLACVGLGGGLGALARWALERGFDGSAGTLTANLLGSLCLGVLLELLARRTHPDAARTALLIRRGLGTGLLGGFTTYSALGLQTAARLMHDPFGSALYAAATVIGGVCAAAVGILLARRLPQVRR